MPCACNQRPHHIRSRNQQESTHILAWPAREGILKRPTGHPGDSQTAHFSYNSADICALVTVRQPTNQNHPRSGQRSDCEILLFSACGARRRGPRSHPMRPPATPKAHSDWELARVFGAPLGPSPLPPSPFAPNEHVSTGFPSANEHGPASGKRGKRWKRCFSAGSLRVVGTSIAGRPRPCACCS